MEVYEWEERQSSTPFLSHMIAGSCAGLSEHLSMLPLDNLKTHCQAGSNMPLRNIFSMIYSHGGIRNFYSGSTVLALGCVPAHTIFFSVYEQAKILLNVDDNNGFKYAFVGAISSLFHDLIMNPTEVIKQRLQLMRSQQSGIRPSQIVGQIYREEGVGSFYRSYPLSLLNIPFVSLLVLVNEKVKHWLKVDEYIPGDQYWKYYLCGWVAGAVAAIPTCPLDVVKTKLNTQDCQNNLCDKKILCSKLRGEKARIYKVEKRNTIFAQGAHKITTTRALKYENILKTVAMIWREEGALGFFRGVKMRMAIQSISSAISWGTYQLILAWLSRPTE